VQSKVFEDVDVKKIKPSDSKLGPDVKVEEALKNYEDILEIFNFIERSSFKDSSKLMANLKPVDEIKMKAPEGVKILKQDKSSSDVQKMVYFWTKEIEDRPEEANPYKQRSKLLMKLGKTKEAMADMMQIRCLSCKVTKLRSSEESWQIKA
jgi:hypothetical protein